MLLQWSKKVSVTCKAAAWSRIFMSTWWAYAAKIGMNMTLLKEAHHEVELPQEEQAPVCAPKIFCRNTVMTSRKVKPSE